MKRTIKSYTLGYNPLGFRVVYQQGKGLGEPSLFLFSSKRILDTFPEYLAKSNPVFDILFDRVFTRLIKPFSPLDEKGFTCI